MYHVVFTEKAYKELIKINKHKAEYYKERIIESLQEHPTDRGKFYGRSETTRLIFFEKRVYTDGGLRFFYTVLEGKITIIEIEYEGKVTIEGSANKNTQDDVADRLGL
jgi:mRNA-degrading endonuclease RelE of RelBE toxin-antitoxin system